MTVGRGGGRARGLKAALADDEDDVVLESVGEIDAAELERTHPSGDFLGTECGEDLVELFDLGVGVCVALTAAETVEFLVVVILDVLAHGGEEAVFLADFVLAAATRFGGFDNFGHLLDAPGSQLLAEPPLTHKADKSGEDAEANDEEDKGSHFER